MMTMWSKTVFPQTAQLYACFIFCITVGDTYAPHSKVSLKDQPDIFFHIKKLLHVETEEDYANINLNLFALNSIIEITEIYKYITNLN